MRQLFKYLILASCLLVAKTGISQQCATHVEQLLPTPDGSTFTNFGSSTDVDGDYFVAGAPGEYEVEANSGAAYVYKFNGSQWVKIAKLVPSIHQEELRFGTRVVIQGNIIIVFGRVLNAAGDDMITFFVFEKDPLGEWTSGAEQELIQFNDQDRAFLDMDFDGTHFIFSCYEMGQSVVKVLKRQAGVFTTVHQWTYTQGINADIGYDISLDNGLLAVSNRIENPNNTLGGIFLYEYADPLWPSTPTATLIPVPIGGPFTPKSFMGQQVHVQDNAVFSVGYVVNPALYVHQRPPTGWADATVSSAVPLTYFSYDGFHINGSGEYLFVPNGGATVGVYKKDGMSWPSLDLLQQIPTPVSSQLRFGYGMAVNDQHLLMAATFDFYKPNGNDQVVTYHSPGGGWASIGAPNQLLEERPVNAGGDQFGRATAINDRYALVGAIGDNELGFNAGAAYVFQNNGSNLVMSQKLLAPGGKPIDEFGTAVAIGDSVLFVTATNADSLASNGNILMDDMGRAYVYRLTASGWAYHSQLKAPAPAAHWHFGHAVAWSKGTVAISEFKNIDSEQRGRVHIYVEDSTHRWTYQATFKSSEDYRGDFFGRTISMNDTTIVVGTGNGEFDASYRMKVHVFTKKGSAWTTSFEDALLVPANAQNMTWFGYSAALYGDNIVVGAPWAPGLPLAPPGSAQYQQGAAYVFKRPSTGWSGVINEIAKLEPSDPDAFRNFGYSVAISYNDIYIGAPHSIFMWNQVDHFNNDPGLYKPGKVYHYTTDNQAWQSTDQEFRQFFSTDPHWIDLYGSALTIGNRTLLVSVLFDDTDVGYKSGSVIAIQLDPIVEDLRRQQCIEDGPVVFNGIPAGGTWSGAGFQNPSSPVFDPTGLTPGLYTVTYLVAGCLAFNEVDVISNGFVIGDMSLPNQIKCEDTEASLFLNSNADASRYSWYYRPTVNDPFARISKGEATINPIEPGIYQAKISHPVCFSFVKEFRIQDQSIPVSIVDPGIVCRETPIMLAALPPGGTWAGAGINPVTGVFNGAGLPGGMHEVSYTFQSSIGCFFQDSTDVQVDDITVVIDPSPVASDNEPVILTASPSGGLWSGPGVNSVTGSFNPSTLLDGSHSVTYTAASSNGCIFIDSEDVLVSKVQSITPVAAPELLCGGEPVTITLPDLKPQTSVMWHDANDPLTTLSNNPQLSIKSPGSYYASLLHYTCEGSSQAITVQYASDSVFVPNIFTPNGDGHNEVFEISGDGLRGFSVLIVDRNGQTHFQSTNDRFKWFATDAPSGVYFWQISYLGCDGDMKSLKGWVQLMR